MDDVYPIFAADAFTLGFGMPLPLSAEHNIGISDLYHALEPYGLKTEKDMVR